MADSIILKKVASIERCIKRVKEDFEENYMRQDANILNLQRACEQSIDLANHLVKIEKLGVPQNSRHAFEMLSEAKMIPEALAKKRDGIGRLSKCGGSQLHQA